jgi:hypothetical protein
LRSICTLFPGNYSTSPCYLSLFSLCSRSLTGLHTFLQISHSRSSCVIMPLHLVSSLSASPLHRHLSSRSVMLILFDIA